MSWTLEPSKSWALVAVEILPADDTNSAPVLDAIGYRVQLGIIVMLFLFGMLGLTYALKHDFWKEVH